MRRITKILMILLVGGMTLMLNAGNSRIKIPTAGWRINNFRKKDCGATLSFEKAPDGSNAVMAEFFGKTRTNVIWPDIKKQNKNWPEAFHGFSGYFWNDGRLVTLRIHFGTKPGTQFIATFKLDHKGWKQIRTVKVTNFQDRSKKMKLSPRNIASIFFEIQNRNKVKVGISELNWESAGVQLAKLDFGKAADSVRTGKRPVIDGDLSDAVWQNPVELPLANMSLGKKKVSNKSWAKVTYDDTNVYLAAYLGFPRGTKLKDQITEFDAGLWEGEDVEFFLYPRSDPRMYYQFMINPRGTRADLAKIFDQVDDRIRMKFKDWNGSWRAMTKVYDDHWTVEAEIPWKTIDADKVPEFLQFQALRCDKTTISPEHPVWSPVSRKATNGFGVLNLTDHLNYPVLISDLNLKRLGPGKVEVTARLSCDKIIGKATLSAWYSAPHSPPIEFTKKIAVNNKTTAVKWILDTKNSVNGYHKFVLKVSPADKLLAANCAEYTFNQMLPAKVRFSDIYLNPLPKKVKWGKEHFVPRGNDRIAIPANASLRMIKTAEYLADRIYDFYGIRLKVEKGGTGRIKLRIDKSEVMKKGTPDWHEAYLLNVTPQAIEIVGAGEAGLFYGIITLMQISAASKQPNTPIAAVDIIDWPNFTKRISSVYQQFHNKKSVNGSNGFVIARIKHWIRSRVAGNKINYLSFCFADQVNYPSRPKLHHPNNFTPAEVREIFDFAREHFIEVFPAILFGAHSPSWTKHYPELIDKKFGRTQLDVANPEVYKLMKDLFTDMVEMSGPQTRYFNTGNDEWWHKSSLRTQANIVYKGKTRQEWFYKFIMAEYNILKKLGVKMIMFNDMLNPKHGGGPPFNLAKVTEKLPRDIIMSTWSYPNEPFIKMGFKETWRTDNGFKAAHRKPAKGIVGFGQIHYLIFDSLFHSSGLVRWLGYGFHTELQMANYAWNRDDKICLPMPEWTMSYMPNLMGTYSMLPNPAAGHKLIPIDFKYDKKLTAKLKLKSNITVGDIPMAGGAVKITSSKPFKIKFPANTQLSSLYILDNVMLPDKGDVAKLQKRFRQPKSGRPYGLRIGKYMLNYADGTKVEKAILLGRNITFLKYTDPRCRYIKEGRAIYPLRHDQSMALLQMEWVNPHPAKTVTSFEIISTMEKAPVVCAGITIRNIKKK
jgi:glycosyl hydrolase family 20/cellulose/xylan binding protein with CBM9 domain